MLLKTFNKVGVTCWSNSKNNSHLMACAAVHPNNRGTYDLDLLSLDVVQKSRELPIIGATSYSQPFRCIAWDCFGEKQGSYPYGLIFGGMEDGSITLWNAKEIAQRGRPNQTELELGLAHVEDPIEQFPVMCAEWNALRPNLLAFGCNQVLIMDVGKGFTHEDVFVKPGQKNPHIGSHVTGVTWNKQVPHILASASENGLVALWDIKSNSSIFEFKDGSPSTGSRNVCISWSKNYSTQVAVTLDDENKNELQIWDLRNPKGPMVVIDKVHSRGINCMDWCDSDPQLILTGSRDNHIVCWNYMRDQQIVTQLQLNEDIIDVKWSKKLPSIFSVNTQTRTQIYSMNESNLSSYVPKWYKVSVGTCIGPGNQLISYNEKDGNILSEFQLNYKTEGISSKIKELARLLQPKDSGSYVKQKLAQKEDEEFWKLVEALQSDQKQNELYLYLGLDREKIIKEAQKYTGKKHTQETPAKGQAKTIKTINFTKVEDAGNFFDSLKSNQVRPQQDKKEQDFDEDVKYDLVQKNMNWDLGKEKLIKQNLLIGNYGGAIDAALKCGRTAEALIIAYSQGQDIFKSTLKTFFTQTTDSFITTILKHISDKQSEQLVKKYQLAKWKECIALIYTMTRDQRPSLLKQLANRLLQQQNSVEKALVCLLLAEDYSEILSVFNKQITQVATKTLLKKQLLLRTVQKIVVIKELITKEIQPSVQQDRLIMDAALVCFDESQFSVAYNILQLSNSNHEKVLYLKCLVAEYVKEMKDKPSYHFKVINIPVMQQKKPGRGTGQTSQQPQTQQNLPPGRGQPPGDTRKQPSPIVGPPAKHAVQQPPGPPFKQSQPVMGFNSNQIVSQPTPVKPVQESIKASDNPSGLFNPKAINLRNTPPPPPPRIGNLAPKKLSDPLANTIPQPVSQVTSTPLPPPPSTTVSPPPPPPGRPRPPVAVTPPPPPPSQTIGSRDKKSSEIHYEPPPVQTSIPTPPPPPPRPVTAPRRQSENQHSTNFQPQQQYQQSQQQYTPPPPPAQQYQMPTNQPAQNYPQSNPSTTPTNVSVPPPARRTPPPPPPRK